MFYYIYKHILLQRIIIALFFIAVCLFFAFHLDMSPSQTHAPLYSLIYNWLYDMSDNSIAMFLIFLFALLGQVLLLYNYTQNSSLKNSQMSIFWFLLFVLLTGIIRPLSPLFFINLIALLIFNIINIHHSQNIKHLIYISGLLVGVASLIETSAIILFIYVCINFVKKV